MTQCGMAIGMWRRFRFPSQRAARRGIPCIVFTLAMGAILAWCAPVRAEPLPPEADPSRARGSSPRLIEPGPGRIATLYGTGEQSRDFLYVKDAVSGTLAISESSMLGTWNVSTGTEVSIRALLGELERIIAPAVSVRTAKRRPGDVDRSSLSNELIDRQLGWHPRHSLPEGLLTTVQAGSDKPIAGA